MPGSIFCYQMKTIVTKCWLMVIIGSILSLTLIATQIKSVKSDSHISVHNSKTIIATNNYTCGISVDPAVPTITDTVRIRAGGEWPDSCVPKFESYQVANGEIRLDFTRNITGICAPVIIGWEHTVEVGVLPRGIYLATARINNVACASKTFGVSEELRNFYLPIIVK